MASLAFILAGIAASWSGWRFAPIAFLPNGQLSSAKFLSNPPVPGDVSSLRKSVDSRLPLAAESDLLLRSAGALESLPRSSAHHRTQEGRPASSTKLVDDLRNAPVAGKPSSIAPMNLPAPAASTSTTTRATGVEKVPLPLSPRERADADLHRARLLMAAGRQGEAAELLQSALAQDPSHASARQTLAKIYLEQKKIDEAMALLASGLEMQPGQVAWALSLARLQVDRDNFGSAQKTLARSYPFAIGNADYVGFFGHVLHRLGQPKEAAELFQAAIRMAPSDGRWWLGLAAAQEKDGQNEEAKSTYRRALETGTLSAELAALAERKAR